MVPSTSLCNLSCVNCSTDDLKGYVVMLASFAFLDKYTAVSRLQHLGQVIDQCYSLCMKGEKNPLETKLVTSSECFVIPSF